MTVDLASLITPETEEQISAEQLQLLQNAGFDVTNWSETDPNRVLIACDVRSLAKLATVISLIARGGYLDLSDGPWLTLLAKSEFDETRAEATICERWLRITDIGGAPESFAEGDIVVRMANGLAFRSIAYSPDAGAASPVVSTTGTISVSGTLDVLMKAESPGSAYNGTTSGWTFVTSYPGFSLADAPAGVATLGTDEQGDAAVRKACRSKWGARGAGANDDAYEYLATHTPGVMSLVTRVSVHRHTPLPGQVTIYVAGPGASGPNGAAALDAGSVAAIQAYIDPPDHKGKAPNCIDVFVLAATYQRIDVTGSVAVVPTELAAAQAGAESRLSSWGSTAPIGGRVDGQKVVAKVLANVSDDPRNDATITAPASDTTLAAGKVPYFDVSGLSWVSA